MSFMDRLFGKGRRAAAARAAEVRGDLSKAAELFGEAGLPNDVARILVLRGDAEPDARARLQFFTQAARMVPEGDPTCAEARRKRAELLLALAGDAAISAVARHEVLEAARDLEAAGEPLKAAEAYARAGDKEGEARALQAAGDVDRLEFLLSTEQHKDRVTRAREDRSKDVDDMIASGRRREALATLEELMAAMPDSAPLRERADGLRARRVSAPLVAIETLGERWTLVLGDELIVGRSEGAVTIASNAVSRQHLRVCREGADIVVRDLQSRNGTQFRGVNLAGALSIGEGLELKLGKEVPIRLVPSVRLPGAIELDVAGRRYVTWLGPARVDGAQGGLELVAGADGWVELVTNGASAYAGNVELVPHTTILVGDTIATSRGGDPALRVVST